MMGVIRLLLAISIYFFGWVGAIVIGGYFLQRGEKCKICCNKATITTLYGELYCKNCW